MKHKIKILFSCLILVIFVSAQKEIKIKLKSGKTKFTTPLNIGIAPHIETKTGYYSKKGLFFQITLTDDNFNKKYNDIGKDYINIEHRKTASIRSHKGVSYNRIKKSNYIQTEDKFFKITYIDSLGNYLKIKEVETIPISDSENNLVKMVDRLPNLEFRTIDDSIHNFRDFIDGEKYIFVEFWGTWCRGCIQILPHIKEVYDTNKDKLTVIYLNSRDTKEKAKQFIKKEQLDWVNGFANKQIERELLLNGYPFGVLFDKKGEVIKFKCSHKDLESFFEELQK